MTTTPRTTITFYVGGREATVHRVAVDNVEIARQLLARDLTGWAPCVACALRDETYGKGGELLRTVHGGCSYMAAAEGRRPCMWAPDLQTQYVYVDEADIPRLALMGVLK